MFANRVIGGVRVPCVALYIVCVVCIVAYGALLRKLSATDVLAKRIYHHPLAQDIDGWSVSHLLFFGMLGVMFPGQHLQFLIVGILWEVVETGLGQNKIEVSGKRLQLVGDQDEDGCVTGNDDAFWYGKESDIVVDILGYCVGSAIASKFWPNGGTGARVPSRPDKLARA